MSTNNNNNEHVNPNQQSQKRATVDPEYIRRAREVVKALDLLMVEDLLTYIKFVRYCQDPYDPKNAFDEETATKLIERHLITALWTPPSVVRDVVKATTSIQ